MALIWQTVQSGKHYEVRKAGGSLRLYTNGVFHSQFNPKSPFAANIWSLLLLPVLLSQATGTPLRILVLGVGGGAVLKLIENLSIDCKVVAVDLDPVHLEIARRFFEVDEQCTQLVRADAKHWVQSYKGPPFDVVIDDLFGEDGVSSTAPERAIPVSDDWLAELSQLVAPEGVLAFNLESTAAGEKLRKRLEAGETLAFKALVRFTLPRYQNVVSVLMRQGLSRQEVMATLQQSALASLLRKPQPVLGCTHRYLRTARR